MCAVARAPVRRAGVPARYSPSRARRPPGSSRSSRRGSSGGGGGGAPGRAAAMAGGGAGGPAGQSRARRHARLLSPPRHARALAPPPPLPPLSRAGRGPPANQPARQSARPWQPGAPGDGERGAHWAAVGRGAEPLRKDELEGAGTARRAPGGPAPRCGRRRAGSAPHPAAARGTGLLKGPRSRPAPQPQALPALPPTGCG